MKQRTKKFVFITTIPVTIYYFQRELLELLKQNGYLPVVISSDCTWITNKKNAPELQIEIKVISMLKLIFPLKDTNVLFMLIGAGMQKQWLREECTKRGLDSYVKFVDPVSKEKVFEYICASDAGTSVLKKVDTFKTVYSNKTFDYMACRKPVLMAIDGVSRELVETANCGFYVEPENPADFAEKIRRYLNNDSLIKEHGENGYNYAKKYFDREVLAKEYLGELRKISAK